MESGILLCYILLEGTRANTGLCVDVSSGVLINESNWNMQPIIVNVLTNFKIIKPKVTIYLTKD